MVVFLKRPRYLKLPLSSFNKVVLNIPHIKSRKVNNIQFNKTKLKNIFNDRLWNIYKGNNGRYYANRNVYNGLVNNINKLSNAAYLLYYHSQNVKNENNKKFYKALAEYLAQASVVNHRNSRYSNTVNRGPSTPRRSA